MKNLITAIFGKFTGSAISTMVSGRIYYDVCPAKYQDDFPRVVFFIVDGDPEDVFARKGGRATFQFSLFSTDASVAQVADMYSNLKTLLDECSLTVTGKTVVQMREASFITSTEEITLKDGSTQTVRHWSADYEVIFEEG